MSRALLDNLGPVLRRVSLADHVLLALDFDGTLAPIAARPELAVLPRVTVSLLRRLGAGERITVAIVSGRSIADLKARVGVDCVYAGNHGLEIEGLGLSFIHPDAVSRRPVLHCACADLDAALNGTAGAFVERKGLSATVHFRQVAACLHERVRCAVHCALRPYAACLDLLPAHKAWEVRPRVPWNKGAAVEFILGASGANRPLVICAGDDLTDEHMFRAVPDGVSIHVGDGVDTAARYSAAGPADLAAFLAHLASP